MTNTATIQNLFRVEYLRTVRYEMLQNLIVCLKNLNKQAHKLTVEVEYIQRYEKVFAPS